jgi:lysyl-tRNA synthetase class 2
MDERQRLETRQSGSRPSAATLGPSAGRAWVPRAAAGVCIALSLINMLVLFAPTWHSHLAAAFDLLPGIVENAAVMATALAGVLLWLLAGGLARRKRRAWLLAVLLLVASLAVRLLAVNQVHLRAVLPIAVTALLLALLVAYRGEFYAVPDPASRRWALQLAVTFFIAGTLVGLAVVEARARVAAESIPLTAKLFDVWCGFIGIPSSLDTSNGHDDDLVYYALLGIGVGLGLVVLYLLLRAPRHVAMQDADARATLRPFISSTRPVDSLGYFALREDKSILWSSSGRSCIAYGVVNGVMLASGDPLGEQGDWPEVMRDFVQRAHLHAWLPAVAACSEDGARLWAKSVGLEALEIGDEAVVYTEEFTLEGRDKRNLRHAVRRLEREGFVTEVRLSRDISASERNQLDSLAEVWRHGSIERGYSMALGRVCSQEDPLCVIVTVQFEGRICGLLQFVPWGANGLSLDVMRREPSAQSGVMDLAICALLAAGPGMGVERVSLNFAPFRSALEKGSRIGAGPVSRAWRRILLSASRLAQIESIYRFNEKFRPHWNPRFIMFPASRDLARVSMAYLRIEGFLPRPRLFSRQDPDEQVEVSFDLSEHLTR